MTVAPGVTVAIWYAEADDAAANAAAMTDV
jgi:hypothetical protein